MILLFALILIVSIELILAILVFSRNRSSSVNRYFLGFSLMVVLWTVSNYLADAQFSFFWTRMTYVGSTGIAFFLVLFANRFGDTTYSRKWVATLGSIFSALILILIWTPQLLLVGVTKYAEGVNINTGPLYILYPIFFAVSAILALWQMIRKYRHASGTAKAQLRFLLAGITLSLVIGFLANSIIPLLTKNYLITKYGPFGAVFFIAFTAYAIIRHRLLDVRLVMRKTFVQVAANLTMLIFILGLVFAVAPALGQSIQDLTLVVVGGIALFISLFFFTPLNQLYERIANKYFFTSLYNYQTTLEKLARQLTSVIDLHKVIDLIVDSIMKTMGLDRAGVLILSSEKNSKRYLVARVIGFNEQNGISLVRDNFLIQWLEQNRKLVVLGELDLLIEETNDADERSQLMRLKTNMSKIEASVCLPLFSKEVLISIIVLGNKVTGEAYTSEDLRLLESVANQAAVAVQNARLYDQVQDFSHNLEEKVQEQTKDIAEKSEHLQELIQMRSEFLTIASHQLRTPLTAIRGLLAMQAEGDFNGLSKAEVKNHQQNMLDSANRLTSIVNDLLKAMELEGGSLHFDFKDTQLEEVIDSVCSDLKANYDHKGLYLTFQHPKPPLPKIEVEPKMLREVLMNIIDNAEKYTNTGGTTINLSLKAETVTLTVKDTGIGIPKADRPKLFKKFSRGEKSSYQHTNGSGLGLFITKNVIDEHHGTVDITSDGEGKGSTVTITLPIHQPDNSSK